MPTNTFLTRNNQAPHLKQWYRNTAFCYLLSQVYRQHAFCKGYIYITHLA